MLPPVNRVVPYMLARHRNSVEVHSLLPVTARTRTWLSANDVMVLVRLCLDAENEASRPRCSQDRILHSALFHVRPAVGTEVHSSGTILQQTGFRATTAGVKHSLARWRAEARRRQLPPFTGGFVRSRLVLKSEEGEE